MKLDRKCKRCILCEGRANVVGPSGDLSSRLVFVGEAPGATEDRTGKPFVGKAGKMLDRLLAENGLPRESIMITNAVKCRPPNNRRPTKEEVEACRPYLKEDLEGRCLIVALGLTASEGLLGRKVSLKVDANQVFEVAWGDGTIDVMPTYHPSACLFNLTARKGLKEGIALAMERCGFTRTQNIS
ncbi:MAG TPA: uracil-DNA glycosylase [Methanomassiliicoccales archaeon]|jgi:DNA polymerase